jgi:arylsulfatase A-like enzyme
MSSPQSFSTRSLCLLLLALVVPVAGGAAENRPNILLILADDLGWGDLGCYPKGSAWGDDAYTPTPHLDRLAARGLLCTDAYATGMVCCPSRAGLLSGRYQTHLGYYSFPHSTAPFPKVKLIPEALRELGYTTRMCGKWHLSTAQGSLPQDRGFDHFFGILGGQHDYFDPLLGQPFTPVDNSPDAPVLDEGKPATALTYLTHDLTERALAYMEDAHTQKRPFFTYLAYTAPHPPLQALWSDLEPFARLRKNGRFTSRDIARAMIQAMDRDIGRLLDWLETKRADQNTLIVFSSDNGGHDDGPGNVVQHNGGLRGRKGYFFEGGIRVPLLISWPGVLPAGRTYRQPVSHLDLYPTFLAAAGAAPPSWPMDGVNLLPHLRGETLTPPHKRLFWSMGDIGLNWAVREGPWKLVRERKVPAPGSKSPGSALETRLYHLEDDPHEQHDEAAAQPEIVRHLKQEIEAFHHLVQPSIETEEVKTRHRQLLDSRRANPALNSLPRVDGAPGHWIGPGAAERQRRDSALDTP